MQIMVLFHLTLNPWQQSCLDHAARTGTHAYGSECPARASISDATADRLYPDNVP